MIRIEKCCADYGLASIYKTLYTGTLYESEHQELEKKFRSILVGKRDEYCILFLCASCSKEFNITHKIYQKEIPYEIV
jgi:hypothetical protein